MSIKTGIYDGTELRCYKNGVLQSNAPHVFRQTIPTFELNIGANYPGDIDAARIINRALTSAEVLIPWP